MKAYKIFDLVDYFADKKQCKVEVVGLRPGERLHECLVSVDEKPYVHEFSNFLLIDRSRLSNTYSSVEENLCSSFNTQNVDDIVFNNLRT